MRTFSTVRGVGHGGGPGLDLNKIGPDTLIQIYEPLGAEDCRFVSEVAIKSGAWICVSPKVGKQFSDLAWLIHLRANSLWLDLSPNCLFSKRDVEGIWPGIVNLVLPKRSGLLYSKVNWKNFFALERLTTSGSWKNLQPLSELPHLYRLELFGATVDEVYGAEQVQAFRAERCRIKSAAGLAHFLKLGQITFYQTIIDGFNCRSLACVSCLEMVCVRLGSALELPSTIESLRLDEVDRMPDINDIAQLGRLRHLSHPSPEEVFERREVNTPLMVYTPVRKPKDEVEFARKYGVIYSSDRGQFPFEFG